MLYGEFIATPLLEPVTYAEVNEGEFLGANSSADYSHLLTLGVYTCKVITIHNPDTGDGLLAHLDGTTRLANVLATVVDTFPDDLKTADIKVVQATVSEDTYLWPTIESVADFFARYSPRSLRLDRNQTTRTDRGVALDLMTGAVHDIDHGGGVINDSRHILVSSRPLRQVTNLS